MTNPEAYIAAIEYALPERSEANEEIARDFPDWNVEKIFAKTGIAVRHLAAPGECASDLAVLAAEKLFASGACSRCEIDFVLFCTQTPDYILPTSACLLQHRLGIGQHAGALDFNLGCSGYVYGLSLAKGLIETGQARTVLFLTADTYSKLLDPADRGVRTIFGDGAAATLIRCGDKGEGNAAIGPFIFGTDGSGAENLIVRRGGFREPLAAGQCADQPISPARLQMNGPEIFNFTLRVVPACVEGVLAKSGKAVGDIDLFVVHQANRYMLEHLRLKMKLPQEKFYIGMRDCGNTVSSSIPIALKDAAGEGLLRAGATVMLLGFGVGYSWGGSLICWRG